MSRQIITQNGKPAFVVVPIDEWQRIERILEDRADAAAVREYWANPSQEALPEEVVRALAVDRTNPVKVLREYRGLTQAALARQIGTSPVYLSQIERGARAAGRKLLGKLAAALRVDIELLRP
ncbi:type II toxin-antitoxin system prevent-host-death family antitoxin [Desertibaculum subflavum]|uniref:type II toxin-antitoxin system prevent-host-death family antitoxin n=1 Tax=Desertibaculum subflavum TaxID=2268458 RepID=UPI000E663758